eukprot:SAG25_NODE_5597_length_640_cov_0.641405_1_plen_36_part_10
MSPASAAGVLECLRTKDAEDTDRRRTIDSGLCADLS